MQNNVKKGVRGQLGGQKMGIFRHDKVPQNTPKSVTPPQKKYHKKCYNLFKQMFITD